MLALILVRSTICTPVIRGIKQDSYGKLRLCHMRYQFYFSTYEDLQLDDLAIDAGSNIVVSS